MPTILYVEDDIATAHAFEAIIREHGRQLELVTAPDGDRALALLAGKGSDGCGVRSPDLIVLDLNLPGMDGFAVYREIRTRRLSDAPVVLFTSAQSATDRTRAMDLGFSAILHKAADFDKFCEAIEQIYQMLLTASSSHREPTKTRLLTKSGLLENG